MKAAAGATRAKRAAEIFMVIRIVPWDTKVQIKWIWAVSVSEGRFEGGKERWVSSLLSS